MLKGWIERLMEQGLTIEEAMEIARVNDQENRSAGRRIKSGPIYKKPSVPAAPKQCKSLPGQLPLFE